MLAMVGTFPVNDIEDFTRLAHMDARSQGRNGAGLKR